MMRSEAQPYVLVMAFVPLVLFSIGRFVQEVTFDRGIGGHLKRAADANSVSIATTELQTAVDQMEAQRMTSGYTSILYQTPDEDVGFWYKNTKTAVDSLKALPATASETDKETKLLKLRQTLVDHKEHGESVTCPDGISVFPNNVGWGLAGAGTVLFLVIVGLLAII